MIDEEFLSLSEAKEGCQTRSVWLTGCLK